MFENPYVHEERKWTRALADDWGGKSEPINGNVAVVLFAPRMGQRPMVRCAVYRNRRDGMERDVEFDTMADAEDAFDEACFEVGNYAEPLSKAHLETLGFRGV